MSYLKIHLGRTSQGLQVFTVPERQTAIKVDVRLALILRVLLTS